MLTITISGPAKSGKTNLTVLLSRFFNMAGIDYKVSEEERPDYENKLSALDANMLVAFGDSITRSGGVEIRTERTKKGRK